jgi:hypothetical protein
MSYKKIISGLLIILLISTILCSCTAKNSVAKIDTEDLFTDRDIDYSYEESEAKTISLNNESITIDDEGIYVINGEISNGQIIIDADDSDKIQIVLNGVTITSDSSAAIFVKSANKVFITSAKGSENALSVIGEFTSDGDTNVDGVIFSMSDLTLNGDGTLNIETKYGNGIVSKDDLKLTSGTYSINASKNGLEANDIIALGGGTYDIISQNDALHCDKDITVTDGNIIITAADDAFHTNNILTVTGGTIEIKESHEGLEGKEIHITGGNITVNADDDGINAAGGNDSSGFNNGSFKDEFSAQEGVIIDISGGTAYINCEGDGIDSNGDISISGGKTVVEGPQNSGNGALDYNGEADISGGTLLAIGSSGMAMNLSSASQGSILVNFTSSYTNEKITITDSQSNVIYAFDSTKTISSVLFSSSELKKGETYTITVGEQYKTVTLNDYIYGTSNGMRGFNK